MLDTNVAGVVRVTTAFLPLLRGSDAPAVVNVGSGLGSVALTRDPDRVESKVTAPVYAASKAAVTMLTTQYAKALGDVRFNVADPGYAATDLNGHSGTQTVTEGTDPGLKEWYLRYVAALNAHELGGMDESIADDVVLNGEPGTRDGVIAVMKYNIDAVPDLQWGSRSCCSTGTGSPCARSIPAPR